MTRIRAIPLTAIVALAAVTARAGDEMDARANAGKPLRLPASGAAGVKDVLNVAKNGDPDVVEQWTAVATRVSSISEAPGLGETSRSSAAIEPPAREGKTLPRTLARRESGGAEGVSSPLDAFRAAPTRSLLPLGVTIGAIAVLAIALRKWAPRQGRVGGARVIQVLSRHALSNKHSLCLVRIGQGLVLLGITPERIATLIEIRDAEEVSRILGTARSTHAESFSTTLRGLARLPAPGDAADEAIEPEKALPAARLMTAGATVYELLSRVRQFSGLRTVREPI